MLLSATFSFFVHISLVFGAIYEKFEDVPTKSFDFIIVGGGTAGNVVANRLSESPQTSVLVLEAGVSNQGLLNFEVPGFFGRFTPQSPWDWNYTLTPQAGLDGRVFSAPRGFILGGSSTVNYMTYTRGSSDDYDRYARVTGDNGWSWDNIQPYIKKNEHFRIPPNITNATSEFDPQVHGFNGINSVTLNSVHHALDPLVFEAVSQLPEEFSFNRDINSGYQLGFGWVQSTINRGVRSSSATSYLAPNFISRPNLNVVLHARVTKVLSSGNSSNASGRPDIRSINIQFTQNNGASFHTLTAKKEVILSAGSYGTPFVLLHSGIGDKSTLSSLKIPLVHHLPSVGQNLTEQTAVQVSWQVNTTDTGETAARNATLAAEELQQWQNSHTGPLADAAGDEIGFFRIDTKGTPFENFSDPSAGPNAAHYEIIILNALLGPPPPTGNFITHFCAGLAPTSRGSVTINSSNPFDTPIINPNLLNSDWDIFSLREAIRGAQRLMTAPAWNGFLLAPQLNATTDDELNDFIRSTGSNFEHPTGTAAMSAVDADYGVVDPDLRVKGIDGLRIVDASILPFTPGGHTQAPTYIVGERASDLIKQFWKLT